MKQTTISVLIVPISATPSQNFTALLGGQNCKINLYQKTTGLYMDLLVNNVALFTSQLCLDRVSLTSNIIGFTGDIYFKDIQGASDPVSTGLGSRYILGYMVPLL